MIVSYVFPYFLLISFIIILLYFYFINKYIKIANQIKTIEVIIKIKIIFISYFNIINNIIISKIYEVQL